METWELTEEEKNKLSDEDKLKYETAEEYMGHDWACGSFGGWVRGQELLIELGWNQVTVKNEHRIFTSLFKPSNILRNENRQRKSRRDAV